MIYTDATIIAIRVCKLPFMCSENLNHTTIGKPELVTRMEATSRISINPTTSIFHKIKGKRGTRLKTSLITSLLVGVVDMFIFFFVTK